MLILIALCTFGTVLLFILGLTIRSEREILHERIETLSTKGEIDGSAFSPELSEPLPDRVIKPFLRRLADLVTKLTPAGALQVAEAKLDTAGRPWRLGGKEFIGLKVLSIALFAVVAILAAKFFSGSQFAKLAVMVILIFIGTILPDYLLQKAVNNRQSAIRKVLADTLDLLTVSVEAGLSLDGAIQRVVEKLVSPLSTELQQVLHEVSVGKPRADALKEMAKRTGVPELTAFVAAVCQADQLGVSIAKVLRVQGDTLRVQRAQRAREEAAKLPVKLLVPLVFCIFPAIFVVILGPAVIQIYRAFGVVK